MDKPTDALLERIRRALEPALQPRRSETEQLVCINSALAIIDEARPQSAAPSPDARSILQSDLGPLTDAFDRMDADEQNEIVERLAEAICTPAPSPDADWLLAQLKAWPKRVDETKTTNIEYLMQSAVARIEALTATAPPSDSDELHPLDLEEIREQQFDAAMEASFRHGAQSMREMLARFVENSPPTELKVMAGSMRANWYPAWGDDPGQTSELPRNALGDTDERDNRHSAFAARAVEHAMKLLSDSDAKGGGA